MAARKKNDVRAGLAPRAQVLLLMIAENTDVDREGSGEVYQAFRSDDHENTEFFVEFQAEPVTLWEVGDRAHLDALIEHGFICRPAGDAWSFVTTAKGEAVAESLRVIPHGVRKRRGKKQEAGETWPCTT